jgi:nickel/cobalt transporter (NicO) family protein
MEQRSLMPNPPHPSRLLCCSPGATRLLRALVALVAVLGLTLTWPLALARAHPMGEFTVNQYSHLRFEREAVAIFFVIDFAEYSTLEQLREIDTNADGQASDDEIAAYLESIAEPVVEGLVMTVAGQPVGLSIERSTGEFLPGKGGFQTLRLEFDLAGALPATLDEDAIEGHYRVEHFPGKLGWHEIVISAQPGVEIVETDALFESVSNELWDYPDISEQDPLQIYDVGFTLRAGADPAAGSADAGPGVAAGPAGTAAERSLFDRATDGAANLARPDALSPLAITLSMLGAFLWGAFHALTPGHGKAIVAAYLIGNRGTARHAAFLGLTVTATHTSSIFALALVTLTLSHLILPETLFPWISVASGALVVSIGVSLGYRRWTQLRHARAQAQAHHHHAHGRHHHHDHHDHGHGHDHSHSHLPPGVAGEPVTWRSLLALGVSGGMVPCPSALLLLLGAISLNRLEFGIVLVVLFSLGLAAVLTGVGLLLVYARSLFNRFSFETRLPALLPVASSVAIALAGVIILAGSLRQAGVL